MSFTTISKESFDLRTIDGPKMIAEDDIKSNNLNISIKAFHKLTQVSRLHQVHSGILAYSR